MDSWRNQGDNFNQEAARTRSNGYRRPPLGGNSNWQQSVPSWEKKFCTSVGSVPWKKLVETKKFIHLYDNVVKWNDSAGKEAFQNAKNRFYANIHGLPCDTPLPDPDIYIDKIDWNYEVDPTLILDLETDSVTPDCENEQVVIFGSGFPPSYQNFSPYGWGDSDDDKKKDPENNNSSSSNNNNWWGWNEEDEKGKKDDGWGWNNMYDNNYFYEKREGSGRYKTSSNPRRNGRKSGGSRAWKPTYSCAAPGRGADGWSVKKPVS